MLPMHLLIHVRESWMQTEREALQKQAEDLLAEKEEALRQAAQAAEEDREAALDELQKACSDELDLTIKRMEVGTRGITSLFCLRPGKFTSRLLCCALFHAL